MSYRTKDGFCAQPGCPNASAVGSAWCDNIRHESPETEDSRVDWSDIDWDEYFEVLYRH